jgi:hypothetical protein
MGSKENLSAWNQFFNRKWKPIYLSRYTDYTMGCTTDELRVLFLAGTKEVLESIQIVCGVPSAPHTAGTGGFSPGV